MPDTLDETARDLMEIKDYFDSLVEEGRLNEDYTLNADYEEFEDGEEDDDIDNGWEDDEFTPEIGEDYWDEREQRFEYDIWLDDLSRHLNLLKIDCMPVTENPGEKVRQVIGYEFVNENLLRQAFTRRAFAVEYGLSGCNEELEFLGDTVLNTIVTRDMLRQLSSVNEEKTEAPFSVRFQEGGLTKIRSRFVSTVDCEWDWKIITDVVDKLICVQLEKPDEFLKASHYDIFNAWHQRRFGTMPEYEVYTFKDWCECTLRYRVPANEKGISQYQRVDVRRAAAGARPGKRQPGMRTVS